MIKKTLSILLSIALILTTLLSVGLTTSAADNPDLAAYRVISAWGSNFHAGVNLKQPLQWTVEFDSPYKIDNSWNSIRETKTNADNTFHYKFIPPAHGSSSFEFIAQGNGEVLPMNFKITYGESTVTPDEDPVPKECQVNGFLTVEGNKLLDNTGKEVRMTGVNWFGFETNGRVVHGLWKRDYKSMLKQIKSVGFNTIRLPWSNAIINDNSQPLVGFGEKDPYDGNPSINADLKGKNAVQVLDAIVEYSGRLGLRIILDNHSRLPDAYMQETLWYTDKFSEEKWIEDWVYLAERYKNNPVVIGCDLDNEPHDNATWGNSNPKTDWNKAAERCGNAILEANPDMLIIVEGVQNFKDTTYWWGGNLAGVREFPIEISNPSKLVYSMHEYGPEVHNQKWYQDPSFPSNMRPIWTKHFGFIRDQKIGHLLCGEFGIANPNSFGGISGTWIKEFMKEYGDDSSWTFWCWNPNSGDTGGILDQDWTSIVQWKMDILKPYLDNLILGTAK